jgi:hypothetical protein
MRKWILITALVANGCSDEADGSGNVAFTTWGEEYIEDAIPADTFEDGWSVKFSKFVIVIRDARVADASGKVAAAMARPRVFDMTKKGVKSVVRFDGLAAKAWTHVSFQIGPMSADGELGDGATEADKQDLLASGASMHVVGTATKDAVTKSFDWSFTVATLYDACRGEKDGRVTEGVVVTNGGTDEVQLTIHGDHLFYDDLQAEGAKVRFTALAKADTNGDDKLTLDELGAVRLTTIAPEDGPYGTGAAANVNNLREFVTALSRTVGHYRGEGECFAKDPPK